MSGTARRRALLGGILVIAAVAAATAADAAWSGGGSGTGSAGTGTTVAVTLSPGTPSAGLHPGGSADVVLEVTNPNQHPVRIGTLALDTGQGTSGFAVDGDHPGCATSALGFATQSNGGAGWTVPAKVGAVDGSLAVTLSGAISMASNAANACQGATFTVYLVAGP